MHHQGHKQLLDIYVLCQGNVVSSENRLPSAQTNDPDNPLAFKMDRLLFVPKLMRLLTMANLLIWCECKGSSDEPGTPQYSNFQYDKLQKKTASYGGLCPYKICTQDMTREAS